MALKKPSKHAQELQKALPPLTNEQVEAIAAFIAASNHEDYMTEYDFCCADDALYSAFRWAANALRNGYGIDTETEEEDDE